ncbi:MAG: hypothetical protein LH624_18945 [Cryobacterium sp.]|nr:hypothetical protein [Cryobacterium sp.]
MQKKISNLGLNNGVPDSTLTDEQAVALFHKNGRNHPLTRTPHAMKVRSSMSGPAPKSSEPKPSA